MPGQTLAYAQLLRLPNAFTAASNIVMTACATGLAIDKPAVFTLILLASVCLYWSGMVFNDWFDRKEDAKTQPFRPIPSGRISARIAFSIGSILMLLGIGFAILPLTLVKYPLSAFTPPAMAGFLAVSILAYDGFVKRTPAGPLGMGLCRFLNILLGFSAAVPLGVSDLCAVHVAAVVGLYIVGVTWFARTEEGTSQPRHLLAAAGVMLLSLVLALLVPMHLTASSNMLLYPYLLVAYGFWLAIPISSAIRKPSPANVQAAVKRCILGLILLDAILASAFIGLPGLLIGFLLLPARWLGKWVYST